MNMIKAIVGIIGVFWLAILGGGAVWVYDRRPYGVPKPVEIHVAFWTYKLFDLPESLQAQRDGAQTENKVLLAVAAKEAKHQAVMKASIDTLSAKVTAAETAAQQAIRNQGVRLHQEIPHVLTPAVDLAFALPVGLVRVHDAAALGVDLSAIPAPAGRSDDQASSVEVSRFASVIADNYTECRADQERLTQIQDWITALAQITTTPASE
jgi:hypothetical protein